MRHIETAIIGAGPYGLSIAAHLRHKGVPFALFGQPMQSWKEFMPTGMILKSERFASSLSDPARAYTVAAFCREKSIPYQATGLPLPLDKFIEYSNWFQAKTEVVPNGLFVTAVEKTSDGFVLTTNSEEQTVARNVVIATGHMPFVYMPEQLNGLPQDRVKHSAHLHDLSEFSGRRIIVMGAGQSALETAALLAEAGANVTIVARKDFIWNPPSEAHRSLLQRVRAPESTLAPGWRSLFYAEMPNLFRHLPQSYRHRVVATKWGPSGAAWLRDRLVGKVEFMPRHDVVNVESSSTGVSVALSGQNGRATREADTIIAATGFKVDVDRLKLLAPALRAQILREGPGPRLSSSFETSVPNLFMVGMQSAPTFGPVMRFVAGTKHAAPMVAAEIASRSASNTRPAHQVLQTYPKGSVELR